MRDEVASTQQVGERLIELGNGEEEVALLRLRSAQARFAARNDCDFK